MARNITIIVLAVAIAVVGYWGYQQHQERLAVTTQAENHYQQVFHNLVYHIGQLQDELGTTMAMSSSHSLSPTLAQVWRTASVAHNEVGQLPLALMPFHDTQAFLSKIGDFSYKLSTRNLSKRPLTNKEYKTLHTLYKKSSNIETQLRGVQAVAAKNHLRWMNVKMALAAGHPSDNAYIDGFKTVDQQIKGYEGIDWGPENAEMAKDRVARLRKLKGPKISKRQAAKVARNFLGYGPNSVQRVRLTGKGAGHALYSVLLKSPKNNLTVHMDISRAGGHPVWMIKDRNVGKAKIGLHKAGLNAAAFLKKHGKKNMVMTQSDQFGNTGSFIFVKMQNGIRIYPESIRVKVALDNGKVVGYDASDYLAFSKPRHFGKPKLTKKQALKHINQNVNVKIMRPAVVTNDIGNEVLCYEILGTIHHDTYRIFVNANTGKEEKVKKLHDPSPIYRAGA